MKTYDISEKYKRIYKGILKWKETNYNGVFQYTSRIDIPKVVETICQHVETLQQEAPYIVIVVPEQIFKDSLRKRVNASNISIITVDDLNSRLTRDFKGKEVLFMDTLILLDISNSAYDRLKINKLNPTRRIGITTKILNVKSLNNLSNLRLPIIDTITKQTALDEGYISPSIIYNVGIEFTFAEKEVYKTLSENIYNTYNIFKGKAKMINYDFKKVTNLKFDMVEDDFKLILACHKGVNYVNSLSEKVEHISSDTVCRMLANIMGWKEDLDNTTDYNKQIIMYWQPDNIKSRAKSFSDYVDKRIALYNNNENKKKAIDTIIQSSKEKLIILNANKNLSNYVETLPKCMCYYKGMSSRELNDEHGIPYKYSTGVKKGFNKIFGEIGILKECIKNFTNNSIKVIATDTISSVSFDIPGLQTIVCTSPYCKPFQTISDTKLENPYINKPSLIIWLYMEDFTIDCEDYKTSKEKEKLIKVQDNINTDIIWTNRLTDIQFN